MKQLFLTLMVSAFSIATVLRKMLKKRILMRQNSNLKVVKYTTLVIYPKVLTLNIHSNSQT